MFRRQVAEGIEIRQFEARDAEVVFASADRNRTRLRQWLPWVDATRSADAVREFIERSVAQYQANEGPNAGIWIDGELGGSIGCHAIDWPNRKCSIGYWVDGEREGKGIVTRCCETMLEYLFEEMKLHRVVIQCGTGNTRSCAVPQRLGFTREGVAREAEWVNDRWVDLVQWSILDAEWRARRGA